MNIIGIDPGYRTTGFGAINDGLQLIDCGTITLSNNTLGERCAALYEKLTKVLQKVSIDYAVSEEVVYHKGLRSTLMLGTARGVVALALEKAKIPLIEYPPTRIKLAVTGNGGASKEQVAFMVKNILHLKEEFSPHITDSLACAITFLHSKSYALRT